jgi:polysaccharide biosynthesis PFTS motif protein
MLRNNHKNDFVAFLDVCSKQEIQKIRDLQEKIIFSELHKIRGVTRLQAKENQLQLNLHISRLLVSRLLLNPNFTRVAARCISKRKSMVYPLPPEWSRIISNSLKVNRLKCTVYFIKFIIALAIKESVKYLLNMNLDFRGLLEFLINNEPDGKAQVIVVGLSSNVIKQQNPDPNLYNFYNWYKTHFNRKLFFLSAPKLELISQLINLPKRIHIFVLSALNLARVRSDLSFLFRFLAIGRYAELYQLRTMHTRSEHHIEYIIVESGIGMEIPIWFDWLTNNGSKTVWFSQSFNLEPDNVDGERPVMLEWMLSNWDYAWGQSFQDCEFIKKHSLLKNTEVKLVGSIWFNDFKIDLPEPQKKVILIFDTEPHRYFYGTNLLFNYGLADVELAKRFLLDIVETAAKENWQVIHKPKRYNIKLSFPEYKQYLEFLALEFPTTYFGIDPRVSIYRLYNKYNTVVISNCFSSVSAFIKNIDGKSIYYDPTSIIASQYKTIANVEVVSGVSNLQTMLRSCM